MTAAMPVVEPASILSEQHGPPNLAGLAEGLTCTPPIFHNSSCLAGGEEKILDIQKIRQ